MRNAQLFVAAYTIVFRDTMSAALVGLAMAQTVGVSDSLSRLTRMAVEPGLGRIVALYCRSSALYRIC